MAGLYLHIPFCKQACVYCDFHFSTKLETKARMVDALIREIGLTANYLQGEPLQSVYFGGGTPSLLTARELEKIWRAVEENHRLASPLEVTLEANPDDLDRQTLAQLADSAVNRLSVGVQSFDEADLRFMNRAHSAQQSRQALEYLQKAGFENFTIDLIYGLPGRGIDHWRKQLSYLTDLAVPHFSAYALTLEAKTLLAHQVKAGEVELPDDELLLSQFKALQAFADVADYQHYELSNFARPGREAVHNSAYWRGVAYLGIGPSAHSFKLPERRWNVANNHRYMKAIEQEILPSEREELTPKDQFNERVMTALRLRDGLDLEQLALDFGPGFRDHLLGESAKDRAHGRLALNEQRMYIPPAHRFETDGIAAALFYL